MTSTPAATETTSAAPSAHHHHDVPVPPRMPSGEVPTGAGVDGPAGDTTDEDPGGFGEEVGDACGDGGGGCGVGAPGGSVVGTDPGA